MGASRHGYSMHKSTIAVDATAGVIIGILVLPGQA